MNHIKFKMIWRAKDIYESKVKKRSRNPRKRKARGIEKSEINGR
jgi:hypothetical protein